MNSTWHWLFYTLSKSQKFIIPPLDYDYPVSYRKISILQFNLSTQRQQIQIEKFVLHI